MNEGTEAQHGWCNSTEVMKLKRTPLGTRHPKRTWMAGNGQSKFGVSACVTVAKVTFSANVTKTLGLEVRVIKSGRGTTPYPSSLMPAFRGL